MKTLITGAAGFIGSHLVEYLLQDGVKLSSLRLLVNNDEPLDNLPDKKFDIIYGDIRDKKTVKEAMKDVDTVFHLASLVIDPTNPNVDYTGVNVLGTKNLLDECKNKKVKKFIFFSSIAVYGLPAWAGDRININETSPFDPREDYGSSKLEAEKEVIKANKRWGIPYIIIRPTSVYGPRDKRNLLDLYKIISKGLFFYIGNGKNKMDYVYVKDLVRAARTAQLSKLKNEDFIIGGGKPTTLENVAANVSKSIGKKKPKIYLPNTVVLFMSYGIKFISTSLRIKLPLFPDRVKVMTANCYFNIAKASKLLKYKPKFSFEKGTSITGKWFIGNYEN